MPEPPKLPEQRKEKELTSDEPHTLINPHIIKTLIERNQTEEIRPLMEMELEFHAKRLAIIREYTAKDLDKIEERKNSQFKRIQYYLFLIIVLVLLTSLPFVSLSATIVFSILSVMIIGAGLINARQRDDDSSDITALFVHTLSIFKGTQQ